MAKMLSNQRTGNMVKVLFTINLKIYLNLMLHSTYNIFQGGFPDSPSCSDSIASREGSSSDMEGESFREGSTMKELDTSGGSAVQDDRQSPSPSCTTSRENGETSNIV